MFGSNVYFLQYVLVYWNRVGTTSQKNILYLFKHLSEAIAFQTEYITC